MPPGLSGDPITGWVTGTVNIGVGISTYNFKVSVTKQFNGFRSDAYEFILTVSNTITNDIVWVTPNDLGAINNNTVSTLKIEATSDQTLTYRVVDGALPAQLTLDTNGQILGRVAYQPNSTLAKANTSDTFTFTIEAVSEQYPLVKSQKTFTLEVYQYYSHVTENIYIKAAPSLSDREILNSLLNNTSIIPDDYIYRSADLNFGKAKDVTFVHA
jgi:hypothetical protein